MHIKMACRTEYKIRKQALFGKIECSTGIFKKISKTPIG